MTPWHQRWLGNALLVAVSLLISIAAIEGIIAYALSHPDILALPNGSVGRLLEVARHYYLDKDRRIVQYLPDCAVYDPEVTYTLKPSARCTVVNREFKVEYAANRAGLRDDDASLTAPTIIVTGDSMAMGWGVTSAEAFPKVLQRDLGVPVLNAAISSYGTARELALIERLKLNNFSALVIQYCDNDFDENEYLIDHGRLDIMTEAGYRALVAEHAHDTGYYPFKHARNLLSIALPAMPWSIPPPLPPPPHDTNAVEARYFLDVLLRHPSLIEGKVVVVLELNPYNRNDGRFTGAVAKLLDDPRYAVLRPIVSVVDVSRLLSDSDYYVLDGHMRPAGHAKVAMALEDELRRRGVTTR